MPAETVVMGRKKTESREVAPAKIESSVMRDARIVVAITGEGLSDYLSRLLRPLVTRDKEQAIAKEHPKKPKS